MYYDVLKYHIVTTLFRSQDRQNSISNEFKKLSDDNNFKVNFYYSLDCKNYQKFKIENNVFNISQNYKKINSIHKINDFGRIKYLKENPGWLGCTSGFLGAINIAKILNWPYLFVFEDDITFNTDFIPKFNFYMSKISNYNVIVIDRLETFTKHSKHESENEFFYKINHHIFGGHAFLINQNYYDFLIDQLNKEDNILARDQFYLENDDKIYLLKNKIIRINIDTAMNSTIIQSENNHQYRRILLSALFN